MVGSAPNNQSLNEGPIANPRKPEVPSIPSNSPIRPGGAVCETNVSAAPKEPASPNIIKMRVAKIIGPSMLVINGWSNMLTI